MNIKQAESDLDWVSASAILLRVVERLEQLDKSLWTKEQISVDGLRCAYRLEELHFLMIDDQCVGVVFLQEADLYFWPDITENNTLYVHKLAIDPVFSGSGYGQQALLAICGETKRRCLDWVRLDCDDRPELHSFYQRSGFELVDTKQIEEFAVARYQLRIINNSINIPAYRDLI